MDILYREINIEKKMSQRKIALLLPLNYSEVADIGLNKTCFLIAGYLHK